MAGKHKNPSRTAPRTRYEYRVWGKHRKVRKLLARLASSSSEERFDDCYLLVDDPSWNAKVRNNTLKIKQLVAEDRGFERWKSRRYRTSAATPTPFDDVFDDLGLDRPQRGKSFNIEKAVRSLDPDLGVRAVFVNKRRRRYEIGNLLAEVTDIKIKGSALMLRTMSIEGEDLDELVSLRKVLGLKGEPNVAVHLAIDEHNDDEDDDS